MPLGIGPGVWLMGGYGLTGVGSTENRLWEMKTVWVTMEYWLYGVWVIIESTVYFGPQIWSSHLTH